MSTHDPRSDAELARAFAGGDAGAFEALYIRHRNWTAALAYRFTGDHDLAMDVLQEAFAYLLRRLPGLRLDAKLTTLLYPVVKHSAMEARRRRAKALGRGEPPVEIHAAPEAGPEHAGLAGAVAGIPEAQREVLLMRFGSGMALDEIAVALGVPLGTVKSRLHNALGRLASALSHD